MRSNQQATGACLVVHVFLTENDKVEQAVLSKQNKNHFTFLHLYNGILVFVCLRNVFESSTSCHILMAFCWSRCLN